ncbi:MAG TPA: hypothetical protein VK673_07855, partial [Chthoniobacterales bacterium]|nr:hypothetical protein [Chthoniobacterales bacterium]
MNPIDSQSRADAYDSTGRVGLYGRSYSVVNEKWSVARFYARIERAFRFSLENAFAHKNSQYDSGDVHKGKIRPWARFGTAWQQFRFSGFKADEEVS